MKYGVQAEGASRAGYENGGRGQLERLWGLVDNAKGPVGQDVGIGLPNEGASWTGCGDWLTVRRGQWELAKSEGASWAGCSGDWKTERKGRLNWLWELAGRATKRDRDRRQAGL